MRTAKTLIRLGDAQADLSLPWAHTNLLVFFMHWLICVDFLSLTIMKTRAKSLGTMRSRVDKLVLVDLFYRPCFTAQSTY